MTVITTQSSTKCPLFGQFQKLDVLTLPTYENVMKAYLWESYSTNKYIKWKNISQIEEIQASSSIPTVLTNCIQDILKKYHQQYRNLLKPNKSRKDNKYIKRVEDFKLNARKLFDVAACKYLSKKCICQLDKKILEHEKQFLFDQRNNRKMIIGSMDGTTTKQILKNV